MHVRLPLYLITSILTLASAADSVSSSLNSNTSLSNPPPTSPSRWSPFDTHADQCPLQPPAESIPILDRDDAFESFEEWKRKREAELEDDPEPPRHTEIANAIEEPQAVNDSTTSDPVESRNGSGNGSTNDSNITVPSETAAPPRPPRGHRYNYAAPDCGSRVLSSSPSTQHGSSILHKSKDRYMLTPCRSEEHYVVVELCDEIRVEAVEVAVWEFFSGIVRGVRVSVGDDADSGEWTKVGEFVGKNARGSQTYTLPEATNFRRFLRIDFPSFYGTEYYCPVSQLKVYGMNQMEAFKMEQREAAEAKDAQKEKLKERERERAREVEAEREAAVIKEREREVQEHAEEVQREQELCELERLVQEQARRSGRVDVDALFSEPAVKCPAPTTSSNCSIDSTFSSLGNVNGSTGPAASSNTSANTTNAVNGSTNATQSEPLNASAQSEHPQGTVGLLPSYRASPRSDASESIYAFIIRRLNALEGNSTLVARYIDEQAKALRAALARSEKQWETTRAATAAEEASRAEAERVRQDARLTRIMGQLDSMRLTFETERRMTEAQLRVMAEELGSERRRSLAQLVVLVSIIVLGALSRGEMIDALLRPLAGEVLKRRSSWDAREQQSQSQSQFQKRLSTGPLAGLLIDVPPSTAHTTPTATAPRSPRSTKRRPVTPTTRRRALRTVSAEFRMDDESPHPLPGRRRLARSSHLHPMPRRDDSASEVDEGEGRRLTSDWTEEGSTSASEVEEEVRLAREGRGGREGREMWREEVGKEWEKGRERERERTPSAPGARLGYKPQFSPEVRIRRAESLRGTGSPLQKPQDVFQ